MGHIVYFTFRNTKSLQVQVTYLRNDQLQCSYLQNKTMNYTLLIIFHNRKPNTKLPRKNSNQASDRRLVIRPLVVGF